MKAWEAVYAASLLKPQPPREDVPCPASRPSRQHGAGTQEECWGCKEWLRGNFYAPDEPLLRHGRRKLWAFRLKRWFAR